MGQEFPHFAQMELVILYLQKKLIFSSVFTTENVTSTPNLGSSPFSTAPNISVTVNGVEKLFKKNLNPHKANEPDQISTRFLKSMSDVLVPALTIISQVSLNQGIVEDWRSAYETPLFKKEGDKTRASKYRPVRLTSVCCMVVEHIIHSEVINHLEANNILADEQHGLKTVVRVKARRSPPSMTWRRDWTTNSR